MRTNAMGWVLPGCTSISAESLATRLAIAREIIRQEAPAHAPALLARLDEIWANPRPATGTTDERGSA